MAIPKLTQSQLEVALRVVGVRAGDGLLVHSALQFLGKPEQGEATYLKALQAVLGPTGTIAVPTFNFALARGEDYDPAATPSEGMGILSEFVRQQPTALRTTHPMQSLAILGARAAELAALDTPSAFDDGSAFDRMLALDFKLLLLGADIQAASIVHYSEQRAVVPYRYWKEFSGRVKVDGTRQTRSYRMFVRDLESDPKLALAPIQGALEAKGQWQTVQVNFGALSVCSLRDFVAAADSLLARNIWALVANKSEVLVGK